jgi:hypothetical protein
MTHYGQVLEDPEYYDEVDEGDWDDINELEDPTDFIAALEIYHPSNTINS